MSIGLAVLLAVIVLFFTILALALKDMEPFDVPPPLSPKKVTEEYELPRDRLLYDAQQRKSQLLNEALRDMGYERREIDLAHTGVEQLAKEKEFEDRERGLELGRREVEIRVDDMNKEFRHRERALKLGKTELDLIEVAQKLRDEKMVLDAQGRENILDRKANSLQSERNAIDLKLGQIDLGIESLRQIATDNKQQSFAQLLEIQGKKQDLVLKDIAQDRRDVLQERTSNQQKALSSKLDIRKEKLELGSLKNRLDVQSGMQKLVQKEIGLGLVALKQQARDNQLSAREIDIRQQYRENQLNIKQQLVNLESRKLTFQEQQSAFRLDMKYQKDELSIRKLKLDLLTKSLNEDYRIKSEWLKIHAGSNRNEYQRQKNELDQAKSRIDTGLESLRLSNWANRLQLKEGDLQQQRLILSQMRSNWID